VGGGGGASGGGNGGGAANGGETCETATTIMAGTLMGNTTGLMNNYDPGCTGDVTPGPDAVYKISVPAGQRLMASATPDLATTGNQYDLAVYLIAGPASNCTSPDGGMELTCLGASDHAPPAEATEVTSWVNAGTSPVDVFIVIDSFYGQMDNNPDGGLGHAQAGAFTLVTTIGPPAMGDRCETAIVFTPGTPLNNQDMANFSDNYDDTNAPCKGSTAADAAYQVVVPPGQLLSVTVTPDMNFDVTLSVSDGAAACGMTCIGGVDVGFMGDPEVYTYKNTSAAAQTLFLVVDGYQGSTGTFSLTGTLSTPPADDTCATPTLLTSGTAMTGQTITNYSNDYVSGSAPDGGSTNCAFSTGGDRVYSVAVNDGQRVTITATPSSTANPSLNLVDGAASCGTACVSSANSAGTGAVETLAYTNRSGSPKTYLVIVDFSAASTGTFDIVANVALPPADDVCGAADTLLVAGTPVTGQTTLGYTNDYQNGVGTIGCASTGATGPDRVYSLSVPANQRALVTVTPAPLIDGGYNPSINLVEGAASVCSAQPRVCAAGSNTAGTDLPETVSIFNTTASPKSYFAIVDSTSAGGTFTIGYTAAVPGADDTCTTNTTTVTAGALTGQNLTGFTADYATGNHCFASHSGDRVYKVVNLAPDQKYTATVTPTGVDGGMDAVINFIPGPASNCEASPRTCLGAADFTVGNQPEIGAFTNDTAAAVNLYVIVADWQVNATNRDFTLTSAIAAAPAGESCRVPQVVGAGMQATQTTAGASVDVVYAATATTCVDLGYPDKVYAITVAAGKTLTVTATPAATEDLAINIIDGAAATCSNVTTCAASADDGIDGDPETATFTNSTGAAKTVFVQVTGYGGNLNYSLDVLIP
jgi:hypothetical protein